MTFFDLLLLLCYVSPSSCKPFPPFKYSVLGFRVALRDRMSPSVVPGEFTPSHVMPLLAVAGSEPRPRLFRGVQWLVVARPVSCVCVCLLSLWGV